jgi:short-subunit dehydrogenase
MHENINGSQSNGSSAAGRTALITGASSGLGQVFARRLAARGYNLLLTARRQERLDELRDELQAEYPITAEVFVADLAKPPDVQRLVDRIGDVDSLEILVNNAGFGTAGRFSETDVESQTDMIQVHVVAAVRLARAALPGMLALGTGAIVNVSSVAGFMTGAGSVTYCATKAYLTSFSQSLHIELRGTGVRVQALCPGFVHTGFHDTPALETFSRSQIPKFLWMSADFVVDNSLKALEKNRAICIPSWKYRLIVALVTRPLTGRLMRLYYRRGLKK